MNEMTVTVDEVARNAVQASTAAKEANDSSHSGMGVVAEMNNNIHVLVQGVGDAEGGEGGSGDDEGEVVTNVGW